MASPYATPLASATPPPRAQAFWLPERPVNLSLRLHPEDLLFSTSLLNLTSAFASLVGDAVSAPADGGAAACAREPPLCEQAQTFEASFVTIDNRTGRARVDSYARTRREVESGVRRVSDAQRARAYAQLAQAEQRRAIVARLAAASNASSSSSGSLHAACAPLVAAGLRRLAPLHHVLLLEDNATFPALHAVARGDLSFSPPSEPSARHAHFEHQAATNVNALAPYKTPAARAMAREENVCSRALYERLVGGGWERGQGAGEAARHA